MTTLGIEQPRLIPENQYIQPLQEVLQEISPQPTQPSKIPLSQSPSFKQSLDTLFPEQQYEEKIIQEAKKILGNITLELSPDQMKDVVAKVQYLANSWLDDCERDIFEGLTLQELLHDKGGL